MILGVSGPIGSGKSTLCRYLRDHHDFEWIEADAIVHEELYLPGQPGYRKIQEYFGDYFVGAKGVNRARLRNFVLQSQQKMWILNKLIHSLLVHEVNKKIVQLKRERRKKELNICLEAFYFEPSDLGKFIERLFVLKTPFSAIFGRLKKRKIPKKELEKMYLFQMKNLPKFGEVIENAGTQKELFEKAEHFLSEVRGKE